MTWGTSEEPLAYRFANDSVTRILWWATDYAAHKAIDGVSVEGWSDGAWEMYAHWLS